MSAYMSGVLQQVLAASVKICFLLHMETCFLFCFILDRKLPKFEDLTVLVVFLNIVSGIVNVVG